MLKPLVNAKNVTPRTYGLSEISRTWIKKDSVISSICENKTVRKENRNFQGQAWGGKAPRMRRDRAEAAGMGGQSVSRYLLLSLQLQSVNCCCCDPCKM